MHNAGLAHLDVKQANVFVKSGIYKLGDFGLVVSVKSPPQDVLEGDSRYMALELLNSPDDLTKVAFSSLLLYPPPSPY
jgi:serine/threonine protein kinase